MPDRRRFVIVACALYAVCALWATWPAIRHVEGHYLARPAAGYGQAAAGDHLQLGWSFWLVGHQLERGSSPLADPYSFRPEAEAPPSLQGWLLGLAYWPLSAAFGDVWAYDLVVLLTFVLAGNALVTVRYTDHKAFPDFLSRVERGDATCRTGAAIMIGIIETLVERQADLIVTMTTEQKRMLADFPETNGKIVMTLHEAAGEIADVEDPAGRDDDFYKACRDQIRRCLEKAFDRLAPPRGS